MIISASRRTDIPNYYSDWFYKRLKEGYLYVRNPMNARQISKISLSPEVVDCIVFWTKNPAPMMERLSELRDYHYYFQFTLTGYGRDIECHVPHKKNVIIPTFQELSARIGKEKVIWRYDPILFTEKYTMEYHLSAFAQIAEALCGYTDKCVISFVDIYGKNRKSMEKLRLQSVGEAKRKEFAKNLSSIAGKYHMEIASCAETMDLADCGIRHNCCIDKTQLEKIIGCKINGAKDKSQRAECGCMESVEIGTYDTCRNGCLYCYANQSGQQVERVGKRYDVNSPILCGIVTEQDKITERKMKSLREEQLSFLEGQIS